MSSMPRIPAGIPAAPVPAPSAAEHPSPVSLQDPALNQSVKDQICALGRRWPLARIAEIVEQNFAVKVSRAEIIAVCAERSAPKAPSEAAAEPASEEHPADKESVHPADAPQDCLLTPPPESPEPAFSIATDAPPTRTVPGQENDPPEPIAAPIAAAAQPQAQTEAPTRTGPGPETEPREILPTEVRAFIIDRMARRHAPWLVASDVRREFGFELDLDEIVVCWRDRDEIMAQDGPEQQNGPRLKLTDEIKAFIVKRIACYETPSRIAAAVRVNFGIDVDRRRIFDYDPKGARPPAQRWIDLHAATRAQFLREVAEIGIAQKVVRLKMLERIAESAEDNHQHDKVARYLQQAARECGGFYEKRALPLPAAA
jgi:hypothetical protein